MCRAERGLGLAFGPTMVVVAAFIASAPAGAADIVGSVRPVVGTAADSASDSRMQWVGRFGEPGRSSVRLKFDHFEIGEQDRVVVRSVYDGAVQTMTRDAAALWDYSTAFFNGGEVEVTLHTSGGDGVARRVSIGEVVLGGTGFEGNAQRRLICGGTDDRLPSSDPAIGRLIDQGETEVCTAWVTAAGFLVTAGHCENTALYMFQLDVPPSLPNGEIQHPGGEQVFLVDQSSVEGWNDAEQDYLFFRCHANTDTQKSVAEVAGAFMRMSLNDRGVSHVRVTGFGYVPLPPLERNHTQQTHVETGSERLETPPGEFAFDHQVDTHVGTSGAPIIEPGVLPANIALGVHAEGDCSGVNGASFRSFDFQNRVGAYVGANVVFFDEQHPSTELLGDILRPFKEAAPMASMPAGGTAFVAAGSYPIGGSGTLTLTEPVNVVPVGGSIVLGE